MRGSTGTACPLLNYPFRLTIPVDTPTTTYQNTTATFAVPLCAPPDTTYSIRLTAFPTFTATTNTFAINTGVNPCPAGSTSSNGREPGCLACDIGTFYQNPTLCRPCPVNTTTLSRGALSSAECNQTIGPAKQGFIAFDKSYFYHSNAGGLNLIEYEHKTQDECARLCMQNPGCKSFDSGGTNVTMPRSGTAETFQAGDCFLSFDNDETIKMGDVGFVNQLELFLKIKQQTVLDVFFRKIADSYLLESNDGGVFRDEHSPEACAQLCLNDASCVSFDAGQVRADPTGATRWIQTIDDCYLSYETRDVVSSSQFIYDPSFGLDYFQQIVPKFLEISVAYSMIVSNDWSGDFAMYNPVNQNFTEWNTNEVGYYNFTTLYGANCQCNGISINVGGTLIGGSCGVWGGSSASSAYIDGQQWCHTGTACPARVNVTGAALSATRTCTDAAVTGYTLGGIAANCTQLIPFCGDATHGTTISARCPTACGTCSSTPLAWTPCYARIPRPCPVEWNHTAEVVDRYPFLATRDSFASMIKSAVATALGRASLVDSMALRIEPSTDAMGQPYCRCSAGGTI